MKYPNLFRPMQVGTLTFRNRILSAPNMMCALNPDGSPTDTMVGYYAEKAKGGAAQVTVGDTPVEERGFTTLRHPILNPSTVQKWSEVARAIRQHGAVASIELNHGGRISNSAVTGFQTLGPVDEVKANGSTVKGASREELEAIANAYGETARLARLAGFDMVMLHGAHGWLLDQMLSPKWNKRTDEFGGSLENRSRFPLMVIEQVCSAVGPKYPIEYRVGPELIEGGLSMEEVVAFCNMIEDKVELIHVSAGLDTDPNFAVRTHPTMFLPHTPNIQYAAAVKQAVTKCPVVAVGSIVTPAEAEHMIASGRADAAAMVRSLIADPYLPQKARVGQDEEIRPCLRCLDCLTGMQTKTQFACAVNPRTGHEFWLDASEKPVTDSKKVLVVGGGPRRTAGGGYGSKTRPSGAFGRAIGRIGLPFKIHRLRQPEIRPETAQRLFDPSGGELRRGNTAEYRSHAGVCFKIQAGCPADRRRLYTHLFPLAGNGTGTARHNGLYESQDIGANRSSYGRRPGGL